MSDTVYKISVCLAFTLLVALAAVDCFAGGSTEKPNIVIILADDLGYGDVQCYNPDRGKIPTPNIDHLASQGMRFTDAHSASAVCSPSRYSLLTGRYPWRSRLQSAVLKEFDPPLIAEDRLTLPKMLKQQGYRTAAVGKWHLGWDWPIPPDNVELFRTLPTEGSPEPSTEQVELWRAVFSQPIAGGPTTRGFDSYFGTDIPNNPPFCFIENDRTIGIPSEFLPAEFLKRESLLASRQGPALPGWKLEPILPTLGERASNFITEAARMPEPFFLYLPLTSPHTPLAVNDEWKGKSGLGVYADLVMETDALVGKMIEALEKSGVAGNTLVLFTSDNGCAPYIDVEALEKKGHFPSGPLRGYKSDIWEGGHRIPFIARWPGVVKAGAVCDRLVLQIDVMATCAELLRVSLKENSAEDSMSFLPLLRGEDREVRATAINAAISGQPAIRKGKWKLIFGNISGGWSKQKELTKGQLYNLDEDIGEKRNLYAERPQIVSELSELMKKQVDEGRTTPGPAQRNDVVPAFRALLEK